MQHAKRALPHSGNGFNLGEKARPKSHSCRCGPANPGLAICRRVDAFVGQLFYEGTGTQQGTDLAPGPDKWVSRRQVSAGRGKGQPQALRLAQPHGCSLLA